MVSLLSECVVSHSPLGSSSLDWSGVLGRRPRRWCCVLSMAAASSLQPHSSHPHCLVCISLSRRRLILEGSVKAPASAWTVHPSSTEPRGRVFPQFTCQARVSSSRLAASVPSGSVSSSPASLLLVPRRPADVPVGQEESTGKASLSPPQDSRTPRSRGRGEDLKMLTMPCRASPTVPATGPVSKLSRNLLGV